MSHSEHMLAVKLGEIGSLHSWELVTAVDGPGTRLTVFLAGCPLRCLYCHNPDTFQMRQGQPVFASDVMQRISQYRKIFEVTGGGVTFSGGEPLMQRAFLANLLAGAKARGVHTTVDTSGFLGANMSDQMIENTDLVLLDIKSGLPETYKRATGRDLEPTIRFGERLNEAGVPIWVRFVLVPGLTDTPDNIAAAARIAAAWSVVERVEVLPFHQMGRDKWQSLGLRYALDDVDPPSREATEAARAIFREHADWEVF
ncbi:MAG: pyruvate formate-lyase-activating protein [Actinomycetaceae bacterium]|nr:pyruvate formate-lyase-activating protein [Actinomycetaceae bacterium]